LLLESLLESLLLLLEELRLLLRRFQRSLQLFFLFRL
jgi:hypothetical protein|tara:strand:- start:933 stop:1043 length:111 start_codon:yes stop_codon:yes gene_type:complete